jgi:hypothetical protein
MAIDPHSQGLSPLSLAFWLKGMTERETDKRRATCSEKGALAGVVGGTQIISHRECLTGFAPLRLRRKDHVISADVPKRWISFRSGKRPPRQEELGHLIEIKVVPTRPIHFSAEKLLPPPSERREEDLTPNPVMDELGIQFELHQGDTQRPYPPIGALTVAVTRNTTIVVQEIEECLE